MAKKSTKTGEVSSALAAAAASALKAEETKATAGKKSSASSAAAASKAVTKKAAEVKPRVAKRSPVRKHSKATVTPVEVVEVVEVQLAVAEPTRGEIAELAYLYWEGRGYAGGSEREDWLRAEEELKQRRLTRTASASA